MTSETWKLDKDLCRCCHAEGNFKNLASPNGQGEMYADMLKNCFDINLVPMPGDLCTVTYTICEACIICLLDAVKFKKSVALCEEKFLELYNKNVIKVEEPVLITIKVESPDDYLEDDLSLPGEDNAADDSDDLSEYRYDPEENNTDPDEIEIVEKNTKKVATKTKKVKPKPQKKKAKPKKTKEDAHEEAEKEKEKSKPAFRLSEADYTIDGAVFKCTRCDKEYDKIFSLRYHVKTKHYKIARYKCRFCIKEFMTPAPLTVHVLEEHNIDERFKCNACRGAFNTKVQLRKHINNFHMLGERHTCEFCDYESFSFESMYKHKFKHKTSKDFQCKFCKKAFLRKTTLALHERIHTGDRRKICNVCGQAFVQKASLNYHMAKYHPEVNF